MVILGKTIYLPMFEAFLVKSFEYSYILRAVSKEGEIFTNSR